MNDGKVLSQAKRYLQALERFEDVTPFFDPAIVQVEWPNRLKPDGDRRDLTALVRDMGRSKDILASQRYIIHDAFANDERVALRTEWVGVLKLPIRELKAGNAMRAHSAMFIEFRDGRIVKQFNHDCFEPF